MTKMTDWLMVIITFVYVVATIFICIYNYRSAKASRDQLEESMRQFEESNRAFVTVTLEVIKAGYAVLHIQNHGKRIAENVNIQISQAFVSIITDEDDREHVQKLCNSSFTLGIGQSWYVGIGNHMDLEKMEKELLSINISYKDAVSKYEETIVIDLKQFAWMLLYESPIEDLSQEMKKLANSTHSIGNSIQKIEKKISTAEGENANV